nr:structural protein [Tolivirales sp.]
MTKQNKNKVKQQTSKKQTTKKPSQRRVVAPAANGCVLSPSKFSMQTVSEGVVRFRGHELLGILGTVAESTLAGVFDLNPACWRNSRLSRIAGTYEKYRYDSFTIRYHPTVPTTAPNAIATYVELEIEEDAATNVTAALNHQYAAMGPAWSSHEVHYRRPPQDPKAYYLTDRVVGNRSDMSQGKIVCLSNAVGPQAFGYVSIEYDVVFMYPELEPGYPGEQYQQTTAAIPVLAAGSNIITNPAWSSAGVKVAEVVLEEVLTGCFTAAGSTYDFFVGSVLYTAWDGVAWLLYQNLEQALSLVNPLRTTAGLGASTLNYFVRKLTVG